MNPAPEIVGPSSAWGSVTAEEPSRLDLAMFSAVSTVGAFTYFGQQCEVSAADVGRYCSIGQGCIIGPGQHPISYLTTHPIGADPSGASAGMVGWKSYASAAVTHVSEPYPAKARTVIGNDVWLGARAIIMQGVRIGNGAIIAAGSVVTKDVSPFTIVGGIPAQPIRKRFDSETEAQISASEWWLYDLSALSRRDYSRPLEFLALMAEEKPPMLNPRSVRFEL